MKKIAVSFIAAQMFSFSVYGQTALDWTKTDCASINHTLYTYLDSEEVVIMEFAMGCSSCTDAATYLLNTKDKYAVSNPGKVNVFYMDYWPGNDCAVEIAPVTSAYAFDGVFEHCLPEKNYYFTSSSSPMPGIVVAAGSFHQVIYQNNSFADDDTLLIEQAITAFFAIASVEENSLINSAIISPNPSNGEVVVNFKNKESQKTKISIYNLNGQLISEILNETIQSGNAKIKMDLSRYPKGMYYINISNEKESVNKKIILI